MTTTPLDLTTLLRAVARLHSLGQDGVSSTQLAQATGASLATVKRLLERLCAQQQLRRVGQARATRYHLPGAAGVLLLPTPGVEAPAADYVVEAHPPWSAAARAVQARLALPLAARQPVSYQPQIVEGYVPNQSALLPPPLAEELMALGRLQGQQPAGTYARKVLEPLLIDLSWASSRLEGNSYSRLDTEALFRSGSTAGDWEAVMLLNHKNAIEFLVDSVPEQGLTLGLVRNLHALLMQDLLVDGQGLGAIRQRVVNISDTVYYPCQVPSVLAEMLALILDTARWIKNPLEAAFFLWVHLAYLQPFEDGNKRTSRLCANIPLMLYNCAPLSFMDVDRRDYAQAMLGVYELGDVTLAVELFDWAYRRSCRRYAAVLAATHTPDPLRLRYRLALTDAVLRVVYHREPVAQVLPALHLTEADAPGFAELLRQELAGLEVYNCARYRLGMEVVAGWIAAGRPQ